VGRPRSAGATLSVNSLLKGRFTLTKWSPV
jgi:hypothetical protein